MDFPGTGFITVLVYASNSGALPPNDALLAENLDSILTEGNDFLLIES